MARGAVPRPATVGCAATRQYRRTILYYSRTCIRSQVGYVLSSNTPAESESTVGLKASGLPSVTSSLRESDHQNPQEHLRFVLEIRILDTVQIRCREMVISDSFMNIWLFASCLRDLRQRYTQDRADIIISSTCSLQRSPPHVCSALAKLCQCATW